MSSAGPPPGGGAPGAGAPPAARAQRPAGAQPVPDPDEVFFHGCARHSVRLGAYLGWVVAFLAVTFGGALAMKLEPLAGYPVWAAGFLTLPGLVFTYLRHVTTRFKISRRRVEFERGILGKDVDSLELWRVLDVTFKQSVWDRILGNAKIVLVGTDQTHPELVLHGLPRPRELFEKLRDAVQSARHTSRPMELVGAEGGFEMQ